MAAPTNTFQTYQAIGIREDLSDVIYRITPTVTPFLSAIPKIKAAQPLHEWQTQDLASSANNAQIEGDDTAATAATPTVRLSNRTQISSKVIVVSGTQIASNTAGRKDELAYQLSLKALELRRDQETALTQNTTAVTGNSSTARQLRGLEGWCKTNSDLGASGADPDYVGNTAPTDGTQRAFTEAQLKNVLQKVFTQGGEPDLLMLGASQKQTFSTFTGNSTRMDKGEDGKVFAATDVYVSDFGEIQAKANRFQRSRTAFVLQSDKWALAVLRPYQTTELAKTGDAEKRLLVVEYTLEARQEKASGVIRDLL
jgi:hypothetical protein